MLAVGGKSQVPPLATVLLEHDSWLSHSQSREEKDLHVFYDLALEVTHGHFCSVLSISQGSLIHSERRLQDCGPWVAGITQDNFGGWLS